MIELPHKSASVWQRFFTENRSLVHRYIVRQIKKAIQEDQPKVCLFVFKGTPDATWIYRKNYLFMLEEALKTFIKEEAYEDAQQVKLIIDQFYINKLIEETSSEA